MLESGEVLICTDSEKEAIKQALAGKGSHITEELNNISRTLAEQISAQKREALPPRTPQTLEELQRLCLSKLSSLGLQDAGNAEQNDQAF